MFTKAFAHPSEGDEQEQEGYRGRVGYVDQEGQQGDGDPRRVGEEAGGHGDGLAQAKPFDGDHRGQLQGLHDEGNGRHDADVEVGRPEDQGEGGEQPSGGQTVGARRRDRLPGHVGQPAPALVVVELGKGSEEAGDLHGTRRLQHLLSNYPHYYPYSRAATLIPEKAPARARTPAAAGYLA